MTLLKNKVNEWQELSLKKDIEKIRKSVSKNQEVHNAVVFDLIVAVFAILMDKFLSHSTETEKTWLFWVLCVLCIAPFLIILIKHIYTKIKKKKNTYIIYSISELIDSFDNDICYYVMMADTYNQMLSEIIAQDNYNNNVATFYYIEAWYYINKAKYKLYSMLYKTEKIFSNDTDVVLRKNLIAINRLVNIALIIEDVRISSNAYIQNNKLVLTDDSILNMNKKYDCYYSDFIEEINENFNNILDIDFVKEDRFV